MGPEQLNLDCKEAGKPGDPCEGSLRLGGHGLFCTRHYNQHAAEFGQYPVTDRPTVVQHEDDWSRRHR